MSQLLVLRQDWNLRFCHAGAMLLLLSYRGCCPLVTQLMKGITQIRPPQPKYTHTWNVGEVLNFIKSLRKNGDLNLKLLSFSWVILLSLTAPDRSLDFRAFHPEGVSFNISGLSKTSRPGDAPKVSFHAAFPDDLDLCSVKFLKCYETLIKEFRLNKSMANRLFLLYIRPYSPVTSYRWVDQECFGSWRYRYFYFPDSLS